MTLEVREIVGWICLNSLLIAATPLIEMNNTGMLYVLKCYWKRQNFFADNTWK